MTDFEVLAANAAKLNEAPKWASEYDDCDDFIDCWQDHVKADEEGEVTVYLSVVEEACEDWRGHYFTIPTILGVSVDRDGDPVAYYDREEVANLMGQKNFDCVECRMQDIAAEKVSSWREDRCGY